jgi:hypothetical protein
LPVSRNVFGKHSEYRSTDSYKAQVTPEPAPRSEPHGPEAERITYSRNLSSVRRQTLREGITELWTRREKTHDVLSKRSGLKQLRNRKAATAPAPLDEILTNPTIHPTARLLIATGNAPGPTQNKKSKYPALQKARSNERKEALHNLYVNAQHFIVNEQQLNANIDEVFGSDEYPLRWNLTGNSVWALQDKPPTVGDMVSADRSGGGTVVDEGGYERLKKIGEVLTGGRGSDIGGVRDEGKKWDQGR